MQLDITDKQFCILCELHLRKTVLDGQCSRSERMTLITLKRRGMAYNNERRWTITHKGANASNHYMQTHDE